MEEMDETQPFHALAKKIIRNLYNGSYSHRAEMVGQLADTLHPDAVIQFCHRRNSHDGQIRTRLEAFLEMLESGEEQAETDSTAKREQKVC